MYYSNYRHTHSNYPQEVLEGKREEGEEKREEKEEDEKKKKKKMKRKKRKEREREREGGHSLVLVHTST